MLIGFHFIGNHQQTVAFRAVCINITAFIELRQITFKKLRHQPFPDVFVWNQAMIKRVLSKTLRQQILQFRQVLFLHLI